MDFSDENSVMEPLDGGVAIEGLQVLEQRRMNVLYRLTRHGRRFFVKGINPEYADRARALSLLRKEYDLGMRLDHRGVVRFLSMERVTGAGEAIIMEWVDGLTLSRWMHTGPSVQQRVRMAREIIDAVDYMAEHGVAHRDLKPDNIMVRHSNGAPCLIDFGHGDSDDYLVHKLAAGTSAFGAPEQHEHKESGRATDVFALGRILEFLKLPRAYSRLIRACLRENPAQRPDADAVRKRFAWCTTVSRLWMPVSVACIACGVAAVLLTANRDDVAPVAMSPDGVESARVELPADVTEQPVEQEERTVRGPSAEVNSAPVPEDSRVAQPDYTADEAYEKALGQTQELLKTYDERFRKIREHDYSQGATEEFFKYCENVSQEEYVDFSKIVQQLADELNTLRLPYEQVAEYTVRLGNYHHDAVSKAIKVE